MTAPSQLGIAYPPSFASSFWTHPDYRRGATVLYSRLQDGLDENESVLSLIQQRARAERSYAAMLAEPIASCTEHTLFYGAASSMRGGVSSSKSLAARAFRNLMHEFGTNEADAHQRTAQALELSVLEPFAQWSEAHSERVRGSWRAVDDALAAMERQSAEVTRTRSTYETRCRQADEAEDDARFAPGAGMEDGMRQLSLSTLEGRHDDTAASKTMDAAAAERPAPPTDAPAAAEPPAGESRPATDAKEPPLVDAARLKRRETLRQQFGFKPRAPAPDAQKDTFLSPANLPPPAAAPAPSGDAAHIPRASRFSTYLRSAVDSTLAMRSAVSHLGEPRHIRLRREAEAAEAAYQDGVAVLDSLRCTAEETLFYQYRMVQRWEADRVLALQRVLAAFARVLGPLGDVHAKASELMQVLPPRLQPAAHLDQLIYEYKTGPFRPAPTVFRPYYHDDLTAVAGAAGAGFGMDLVSTAKGAALAAQETSGTAVPGAMPMLPPVLLALLSALQRSYAERVRWVPRDSDVSDAAINAEKRRIWLYDVPLPMTHALRAQLRDHYAALGPAAENSAPDQLLDAADAPVLAATVRLWLLELDSPLLPYSSWDEVAAIYEAADVRGAAEGASPSDVTEPILQGVSTVLGRLPKLHLTCVDAFVAHLYKLVKDTPTDEDNDTYTSKLGLALGRTLLRPATERPSTVHSKLPALLLKDLVTHYEALLPPLMAEKAKESDLKALSPFRHVPIRRRPSLVDQRIKRSSLQGLGLPTEGLQRRATQIESRHVSSPGVRFGSPRRLSLVYRNGRGARGVSSPEKPAPRVSADSPAPVAQKPSVDPTAPADAGMHQDARLEKRASHAELRASDAEMRAAEAEARASAAEARASAAEAAQTPAAPPPADGASTKPAPEAPGPTDSARTHKALPKPAREARRSAQFDENLRRFESAGAKSPVNETPTPEAPASPTTPPRARPGSVRGPRGPRQVSGSRK